jgi:SAM-dependent methyltransferase
VRQAIQTLRGGGTTALDIGCGTGNLLRRLAPIFPRVVGIEADSATAALAAAAVLPWPTAAVVNASSPADSQRYDFVSMVAALHHLPLLAGIEAARATVGPGGRLVIVGVYREERTDVLLSVISLVLNPIIGLMRHPGDQPDSRRTCRHLLFPPRTPISRSRPPCRVLCQGSESTGDCSGAMWRSGTPSDSGPA